MKVLPRKGRKSRFKFQDNTFLHYIRINIQIDDHLRINNMDQNQFVMWLNSLKYICIDCRKCLPSAMAQPQKK